MQFQPVEVLNEMLELVAEGKAQAQAEFLARTREAVEMDGEFLKPFLERLRNAELQVRLTQEVYEREMSLAGNHLLLLLSDGK